MGMRPVAAGTLPDDLIEAIRGGTVTLSEAGNGDLVFHDTHGAVQWHCSHTVGEKSYIFYRHQQTGASGTARIPRFSTVKRISVKRLEKQPQIHVTETSADSAPPQSSTSATTSMTLSDVMRQHRALALKVAHFLAPLPKDHRELLRVFASEDSDALSDVLKVLTVVNRRGQLELEAAGYELVDIERYSSRALKQQVANMALPKVAHNKALWDRVALYADRDVMLDACSKGVMSGLGNDFKRQRDEEDDDDDNDGGDAETKNVDDGAPGRVEREMTHTQALPLLTSMDQSGIRWSDGDISKEKWVMSSTVKEVLAQRQQSEASWTVENQVLVPMPVANAAQLVDAQKKYDILLREYQAVHDILKRLEDVSEAARAWCQTHGSRFSDELRGELQRWFDKQEGPKSALTTALDVLHRSLYQLKREIEDYMNLREWGVLV